MKEICSRAGKTQTCAFCRQEQWSLEVSPSLYFFSFLLALSLHLLGKHCSALSIFASSGMEGKKKRVVTFPAIRRAISGFPGKGCSTIPSQGRNAPPGCVWPYRCTCASQTHKVTTRGGAGKRQGHGGDLRGSTRWSQGEQAHRGQQGQSVGPGHHFVASTSREVKHHSSCHGLQLTPPQEPNMLTPCHPFCIVYPASVSFSREV